MPFAISSAVPNLFNGIADSTRARICSVGQRFRSVPSLRKGPGSDGVNADLVLSPFNRQCFAHRDDTGFGRNGMNIARPAVRRLGMNDADNRAFLSFNHAQSCRARAVKGAVQNNIHNGVPSVDRKFFGARDEIARGVVDQHIDFSEAFHRAFHHAFHRGGIANINRKNLHLRSFCRDLCSRFAQLLLAPARNQHRSAQLGETQSRHLAQPRSAARYNDRLILKNSFLKNMFLLCYDSTIQNRTTTEVSNA